MGFKTFLNALVGGSGRKFPVEDLVISAVADALGEAGGRRLRSQASLINKVQRLAEGKEVNFYSLRNGKPWFDESLRFPLTIPEAKLASVSLVDRQEVEARSADLWLVNGWIFSITFNKSMKGLEDRTWKARKVRVFLDPFESFERGPAPPTSRIMDVLGGPDKAILPGSIKGPVLRKGRPIAHSDLGFELPGDVTTLFSLTGGFRIGDIEVLGADSIRQVELETGSCTVLAESTNGDLLAYAALPGGGNFLLIRPATGERTALQGGFSASLRAFLDEAGRD